MDLPEMGSVVLIHKGIGIVRFIGPVHWDQTRTYLGIALCDPMGIHDGSYRGFRYFRCKDNHGIFVEPKEIKRSVKSEELLEKIVGLNHRLSENQKKIRSCENHIHELEEENLKLKNDIRELTDLEEAPIMPLPDVPRASETRIEMIDASAIVGSAITAEQLMGSDAGLESQRKPKKPERLTAGIKPNGPKASTGDFYEEMGQDIGSPLPDGTTEDEKTNGTPSHYRQDTLQTAPIVTTKREKIFPKQSASASNTRKSSAVGAFRRKPVIRGGRVDMAVHIPTKGRIHIHDDNDDLRSLPTTLPDLPETPIRQRNSNISDYKIDAPVFEEDETPKDQRKSYVDHWKDLGLPEKRFDDGIESPRTKLVQDRFRHDAHHRKKSSLQIREMFEDKNRLQDVYGKHGSNGVHSRHNSHGLFQQPLDTVESQSLDETETRESVSNISDENGPPPDDEIEEIVEDNITEKYANTARPSRANTNGNLLAVALEEDDVSSFRSYKSGSQSARRPRPHVERLGFDDVPARPHSRSPMPDAIQENGVTQLRKSRRTGSDTKLHVHRRGGISLGNRDELYGGSGDYTNREHDKPKRSQPYGNGTTGRKMPISKSNDILYEEPDPSIHESETSTAREEMYAKVKNSTSTEERAQLFHSILKSRMQKMQQEEKKGKERRLNRFSEQTRSVQSQSAFGYDEVDRKRDGIYRDHLNYIDETRDDDVTDSHLSDDVLSDRAYFEQVRRQKQEYNRSKNRGRRSISQPVSPRNGNKSKYSTTLNTIPSDEAVHHPDPKRARSLRMDLLRGANEPIQESREDWNDGRDWLAQMDQKLNDAMKRFDEARQATLTSMSNAVEARRSKAYRRRKRTSISAPGSPRNEGAGTYATNLRAFPHLHQLRADSLQRPNSTEPSNRKALHGSGLERHMGTGFAGNRGGALLYEDDDDLDIENGSSRYEM